jgi:hypothetical protein
MHSSVWVALLRHIPPDQQDRLMLVTAGGTEIAIGGLLRIDRDFVAIKGRLSGSQDAGRVFFIPYDQIDYFGFQKPIKESEFHELFDDLALSNGVPAPSPAPVVAAAPEPAPAPAALAPAAPAAATSAAERPATADSPASHVRLPIKSAVLERFRSRSSNSIGPTE